MKITERKLRKIISSIILEVSPRNHSQLDDRNVSMDYSDHFYYDVVEKISEHLHDMGAEDLGESYSGVIDDLANELAGQFSFFLKARRDFVAGIVEMNKAIAHIEEIEQSLENGKLAQMFDDYDKQSPISDSSSKGYDLACIISDIKDEYIQYIAGLSNSQITSLEKFVKKTNYDR